MSNHWWQSLLEKVGLNPQNQSSPRSPGIKQPYSPPVWGSHCRHFKTDTLIGLPVPEGGGHDTWDLKHAFEGVQIFGGIGSGKSSGSGQAIARAFIRMGYGGVVLTAKINEVDQWKRYFREIGRPLSDLIIFEAAHNDEKREHYPEYTFNPLQYEMDRPGGGDTLNLTNLIMSIYEMSKSFTAGGNTSSGERYWDDQLRLFISRSIDLLRLSDTPITIENMRSILTSAPDEETAQEWTRNLDAPEDDEEADAATDKLMNQSLCLRLLYNALDQEYISDENMRLINLVESYFLIEFAKLSEKTRSIIETSFYGMVEPFMGGILRKYFTGEENSEVIMPEACYENWMETGRGKVIVINFPIKKHLVSGVIAQAVYKKLWQEAIERRPVKDDGTTLPVFLWVDEAQYFLGKDDAKFQTTARESRACTVFITQNISNYYAMIGGKNPKVTTDSLLGVLGTKIFHANNDYVTNEWAAKTIGRTFQMRQSVNSSLNQFGGSITESEALHYQVEPEKFTTLRSGGEINDFYVDGFMTVSGKRWINGKNYVFTSFPQEYPKIKK